MVSRLGRLRVLAELKDSSAIIEKTKTLVEFYDALHQIARRDDVDIALSLGRLIVCPDGSLYCIRAYSIEHRKLLTVLSYLQNGSRPKQQVGQYILTQLQDAWNRESRRAI